MKKMYSLFVSIFLTTFLLAQSPKELGLNAITKSIVKGELEFLASDWTEGRATGTRGEYIAGDYIASQFKIYGILPYGDADMPQMGRMGMSPRNRDMMPGIMPPAEKTYFQNISMIEYKPGEEQTFSVITKSSFGENAVDFAYKTDFSVRTGNVGLSAEAPVVFAGYGFTDEKKGYDDYNKLDVKGKVVIILNGFPGHKDQQSEAYKKFKPENRFAESRLEREKPARAEKLGAIAIIQVRAGDDPAAQWANNNIYPVKGTFYEADVPMPSFSDTRMALPGDTLSGSVPVFTLTKRAINLILAGTGIDFDAFEKTAQEKMVPFSRILNGKTVAFKTTVSSRIVKARNVLGYIEGEKKDNIIVVGAHYDHLGKINGWTWNGADDNGSGTVGVMTIAKAFAASGKKPEKTIVFATWTGEEKGLLGSEYFVSKIPKDKKVILNLNFDMISRNEETDSLGNKAEMMYTEDYGGIKELTEKNIAENKINLNLSYRPSKIARGGSDHSSFAKAGVPYFYFMAAMHPDYHQPSDEVSKVNWDKITNIIRLGFLDTWEFANGDQYLQPVPEKK